jgi:hypothetical protein
MGISFPWDPMRRFLLLGVVAVLILPTPAFALRELMFGNTPISPGPGFSDELLAALNVPERVVLSHGPMDGEYEVYFKGGPKALNEAIRRFAAVPAGKHEVILVPYAAPPLDYGKDHHFTNDWAMHFPGNERRRGEKMPEHDVATMTIHVPNPPPPAPADPTAIRQWIAKLGSDDFKTRAKAAQEIGAVGPPAAALIREALKGEQSAEARERLSNLLGDMSREIRVDTIDLPAGLTVLGPDDLLARARAKLADRAGQIRSDGAALLIQCGVPAEEVLPELEKVLKSESELDAPAKWGAAMGATRLGAAAKPLLPALKVAAGSKIEYVATMCKQAIAAIEKAKDDPIPEAEAKKRAAVRKAIQERLAK